MWDFVWKVKNSFSKVKVDFENLKENTNEWIVFLDDKNNETEKRLDRLEGRLERLEETMFKILSLR